MIFSQMLNMVNVFAVTLDDEQLSTIYFSKNGEELNNLQVVKEVSTEISVINEVPIDGNKTIVKLPDGISLSNKESSLERENEQIVFFDEISNEVIIQWKTTEVKAEVNLFILAEQDGQFQLNLMTTREDTPVGSKDLLITATDNETTELENNEITELENSEVESSSLQMDSLEKETEQSKSEVAVAAAQDFGTPPPPSSINIADSFHVISNGDSYVHPDYPSEVVLTNDVKEQVGGVWYDEQINLDYAFTTEMDVYLGNKTQSEGGADGITFVLQNDPQGKEARGVPGRGLGAYGHSSYHPAGNYNWISNSLVFEFDTFRNGSDDEDGVDNDTPVGSKDIGHFGVNKGSANIHGHEQVYYGNRLTDGNWHKFNLKWNPTTKTFTYSLAGIGSGEYIVSDVDDFFNGNLVYWGFTGSTGGSNNFQAVNISKLPAQPTVDLTKEASQTQVVKGEEFSYTLNVSNTDAELDWLDVVATDNLDTNYLEYIVGTTKVDDVSIVDEGSWKYNKLALPLGVIGPGQTKKVTFSVKVKETPDNRIIHNVANATGKNQFGNSIKALEASVDVEVPVGSVILTKTDKKTGENLSGAVFELQDKSGNTLQEGLTTGLDGQLLISNLDVEEYQLVETQAPAGYEVDHTPIPFSIKKGQTEAVELTMTNNLTLGSVVLTKVDANSGETLQGAVFDLYGSEGVLQSGVETNSSGKLAIDGLVPGEYQLVETQAPVGYELDETPVTFTIEKGQIEAVQLTKVNHQSPGSVVLTKIDDKSGKTLQGAVFDLQDSSGKTLQNGLETDKTGRLAIDNLEPGDYQLVEIQAPVGYELDATPVKFEIEKGQTKTKELEKSNKEKKQGVRLHKIDEESLQGLSGAVFELKNMDTKELIDSNLSTDSSGIVLIDELEAGSYQLIETKAPNGYILDQTPLNFTVSEQDSKVIDLVKTNRKKDNATIPEGTTSMSSGHGSGANYPSTGETTSSKVLIGIGLLVLVTGVWLYREKRVK